MKSTFPGQLLRFNGFLCAFIFFSAFLCIIIIKIHHDDRSILLKRITTYSYTKCDLVNDLTADTRPQSFASLMRIFPWNAYRNATTHGDIPNIQHYSELLLTTILIPFTTMESPVPLNKSCKPPPLLEPQQKFSNCSKLTTPRKIGALLNFGFDVDALEVHLQELDAVVDKFFLMEGIKIHNKYLDIKPSIWDMVKFSSRFAPFRHKVVHFIVDDAAYSREEGDIEEKLLWDRENLQAQLRLQKFLEWNNATKYFSPDDLIGIGDTDEIPSRGAINYLKHCEIHDSSGAVDIGIWFPMPYADTIYKTDFPVSSHPYTLGDPTYWTLTAVTKLYSLHGKDAGNPGRRVGRGAAYLLGGMHFSAYPYLPFQLIKLLTGTERALEGISRVIEIGSLYLSGGQNDYSEDAAAIKLWESLVFSKTTTNNIKSVDWFRTRFEEPEADSIIRPPWFYQCNSDRFASFGRKRDARLDGI